MQLLILNDPLSIFSRTFQLFLFRPNLLRVICQNCLIFVPFVTRVAKRMLLETFDTFSSIVFLNQWSVSDTSRGKSCFGSRQHLIKKYGLLRRVNVSRLLHSLLLDTENDAVSRSFSQRQHGWLYRASVFRVRACSDAEYCSYSRDVFSSELLSPCRNERRSYACSPLRDPDGRWD